MLNQSLWITTSSISRSHREIALLTRRLTLQSWSRIVWGTRRSSARIRRTWNERGVWPTSQKRPLRKLIWSKGDQVLSPDCILKCVFATNKSRSSHSASSKLKFSYRTEPKTTVKMCRKCICLRRNWFRTATTKRKLFWPSNINKSVCRLSCREVSLLTPKSHQNRWRGIERYIDRTLIW